ncbi:GIY-YIG nuclease family protein [Mycoplasma tauri]|uniref:GIY-YIG nuclease family protein n=1 Tax=Mycoplasma tauri TaxID=547987 RepID=UPI001CBE557A|nr:GIY-YIG nuclease family protein [Mycoplasma tauri]MBZ4226846.1 GIY-YIG nuclease family protein [Mycoplasma tauri]
MQHYEIIEKIKNVSTSPGIYLWKDNNNQILYVGKAKNLRKRMLQYFEGATNSYKTHKLVSLVSDFEVYLCKTNKEALILEKKFIDKYNPEFNILLLDDKKYPYLKLQLLKNNISISLSRKVSKNNDPNTFYYGPFPTGYGARPILKLLEHEILFDKGLKINSNDHDFWKKQFTKASEILSLKNHSYLQDLEKRMHEAAKAHQFELATFLRDGLFYLKKLKESQIIELSQYKNIDVFAYKVKNNLIFATILFYRFGSLINKTNLEIPISISESESINFFFEQFYKDKILPDSFIVPEKILELNLNLPNEYKFIVPKIGINKKILDLCFINLEDYYDKEHFQYENKIEKSRKILETFNQYLNLDSLKNIVIFDNSNINNTNPVGVAIVYTNGIKNKSLYRKFNLINENLRHSDVEYMRQSVLKFFNSLKNDKQYDLVIADGGIAQVNEVKKTLNSLNLKIPVIGLVKDDNHKTKSLIDLQLNEISISDQNLYNFLSEIQIEVDRFAKVNFRKRKKINSLEGKLTSIPGLGIKMENKLLKTFGNYSKIYNASLEELEKVIPKKIAFKIYKKEFE